MNMRRFLFAVFAALFVLCAFTFFYSLSVHWIENARLAAWGGTLVFFIACLLRDS